MHLPKLCSVLWTVLVWLICVDQLSATPQEVKLLPLDGDSDDDFGNSVSLSGTLALVGAKNDDDNGFTGSAYVFDATTGQQLHKLLAGDGAQGDEFGCSVSLDGGLALVGARGDDDNGLTSGSAYLFDTATGQQLHKLLPTDGSIEDRFGSSVSLSGDLALIGAGTDDDNGKNSGSAYVFDATTGQQLHKLLPADGVAWAEFGCSVSLDGHLALVGAYGDYVNYSYSGSAYVYDASTGQQLRKLLASDGPSYFFGYSVSLDGGLALVGAWWDDDNGSGSGSAYVFVATTGQRLRKLLPSDGATDDHFGYSVSIHEGGALAGAPDDDDNGYNAGSAYVFDATPPGTGHCFGDPGSGNPCPCGNDNDGGQPGFGCANGVFTSGAQLTGSGVPSVSSDTLALHTDYQEPSNSGLYFQGATDLGPGMLWGDGLRCTGGGITRLQVRFADAAGSSNTTISLATKGGVSAGETRYYQCWYRNPQNSPCGAGFNTTNGYSVTWLP